MPSVSSSNVTSGVGNYVTSGPLFDAAHDDQMSIFIYPFVFTILLLIVGFVGNLVVIYIFIWQWKLTKTTVFILSLAGVDMVSCLLNMPIEAAMLWHPLDFDHDALCKLSRYTTFACSAASSFLLVAISIDRYVMVCRPFLGRELSVQYARRTCLVAVMLGLITTWPPLIFYGTYTYAVDVHDPSTDDIVQVEGKTCMIANYYVENYRLPAGFYFFLFGAHVIMFVIITMVYTLIGRTLFMSSSVGVSEEKRHSMKYFGISVMSALTGTLPSSPNSPDRVDTRSVGSRSSRAVSMENLPKVDRNLIHGTEGPPYSRESAETNISIIVHDDDKTQNGGKNGHVINAETRNAPNIYKNNKVEGTTGEKITIEIDKPSDDLTETEDHSEHADDRKTDVTVETSNNKPKPSRDMLRLSLDDDDIRVGRFQRCNERLSSESVGSDRPLAGTPDSVARRTFFRGHSLDIRGNSLDNRDRLSRIVAEDPGLVEVKEFSLRRNTLMLRMVTIAFIVSFLPYLIIVTIRYSNPDVPTKLNQAEQITYHIFLRTYFINSMINPFIYGFMNEEFRMKLKNLFCSACTRMKR